MAGASIAQLNGGYASLVAALKENELASLRIELGVMTFGGPPNVVQDFETVDQIESQAFTASGNTPMGEAIRQGVAMIEERKKVYRANGIPFYRPWIFLFSDGQPTDEWESVVTMVEAQEEEKHVVFFAVGVDNANMEILNQISVRKARYLKEGKYEEMFQWLSDSLSDVADSAPGETTSTRPADGWGTISV
jgi:uncharacterized protein YegL